MYVPHCMRAASGGLWPYYWSLRKKTSQGAASSICHVDEGTGVPYINLLQLASLLRVRMVRLCWDMPG